jgi:hypothetical protein
MVHDPKDLTDAVKKASSDAPARENADSPSVWHPPSASVIDIKRTLLLAGSGSDLSGRTTP